VPVHPRVPGVEQDRPGGASVDRTVDRTADSRRQRHQNDPGALADNPQHPVAVFLAEISDIGAGRLEDAQPQQSQHRYQSEVVAIRRLAASGQHGLELQVRQPEGRGLRRHGGPSDVLRRGMLQSTVDDAGAIEAGDHRGAAGHRRRLVPAGLLQPPDVQLQVTPRGRERVEIPDSAPVEEDPKIGVGVQP